MFISRIGRIFICPVWPFDTIKLQLLYKWMNIGTFQPKLDKVYYLSRLAATTKCCGKKSQVRTSVKLISIDNKKTTVLKKISIFDQHCHMIRIQKLVLIFPRQKNIVDWSRFPLKTTCFTKVNPAGKLIFKHTHIVLFKSPSYVMQLTTLMADLGKGSELDACFWDGKSLSYGRLEIVLLPWKYI